MTAHSFSLAGQTVLVAGATGDIGSAACRVFTQQGARVLATGRDVAKLNALEQEGAVAGTVTADLTQAADLTRLSGGLTPIDGLVFACGRFLLKPLRGQTLTEWNDLLGVNVTAAMALTRELLRAQKLKDGAAIVYVSSVAGSRGAAGYTGYAASKGAVSALARSLALELAPRQMRVNTVSPGMVASRMADRTARLLPEGLERHWSEYPLGRGGLEDAAWAIGFLISPAARWITGVDLVVDGGWSIR